MARRSTGRWVARAAATGGGRTYRGQAPVRWYTSLVLIVLLGVALVVYSRSERLHPAAAVQPAVGGTPYYAAIAFDVCGRAEASLPANATNDQNLGIVSQGSGVIKVAPTSNADAGTNAVFGRFVDGYPDLKLTSTTFKLPGQGTYRDGGACPSGTPYARKRASIRVVTWASATGVASTRPTTVSDPASLTFTNGQLITVAYVPSSAPVFKPSAAAISSMQDLISGVSTSTTAPTETTAPVSTSTTAPASTSTTVAPTTSTTLPATTTTTKS